MILFDGMECICLLIMFISLFSLQNYENEKTFIGAQGKLGVYLLKPASNNGNAFNSYVCNFTGPLKNAVSDFIRLLWEQNVPLVVMVTNVMEDNAVSKSVYFTKLVFTTVTKYIINIFCICDVEKV